jgi:GntR family transcriptional repressor for pyruvate dehydrogenase complex
MEDGSLAVGDQLPSEAELKSQFGVGRSTIREALNGLVLIGAIEVRHGQGAFVLHTSAAGRLDAAVRAGVTRELLEAREAVELAIARLAAQRATQTDIKQLHALLDRAEARIEAEGAAVDEAARFHLLLAEASQNEIFVRFIEQILYLLQERGEDMRSAEGYGQWELGAHRDLLAAVASGNGERAQLAMTHHLRDMRSILFDGWTTFAAASP